METNNTEQFLNQYGLSVIAKLIQKLRSTGKVASGRLINSLKEEVKENVDILMLNIKAEDYFQYVIDGRKPGAFPPLGPLYKWAKIKGIPKSAVFPIAKSIYKFGIKPDTAFNNWTSDLNEPLKEGISKAMVQDIELELKNIKQTVQNY